MSIILEKSVAIFCLFTVHFPKSVRKLINSVCISFVTSCILLKRACNKINSDDMIVNYVETQNANTRSLFSKDSYCKFIMFVMKCYKTMILLPQIAKMSFKCEWTNITKLKTKQITFFEIFINILFFLNIYRNNCL